MITDSGHENHIIFPKNNDENKQFPCFPVVSPGKPKNKIIPIRNSVDVKSNLPNNLKDSLSIEQKRFTIASARGSNRKINIEEESISTTNFKKNKEAVNLQNRVS